MKALAVATVLAVLAFQAYATVTAGVAVARKAHSIQRAIDE